MTIRHAIWKVGQPPSRLETSTLVSERELEEMIVAAPEILHGQWMIVGRQQDTGFGSLDLLAIAPDGSLIVIELKRNRTPRDVVAQAIDYATFVERLDGDSLRQIYKRFCEKYKSASEGGELATDFKKRFGSWDEESLNSSHQIVVVADVFDESTTRIVRYLNDKDIPINVLSFQVFSNGNEKLLSRAWLLDPAETQVNATATPTREKEPWNGEFYVNFSAAEERSWDDAIQFGFISAGGGSWYTNTLELLKEGDRIWAKSPEHGFIGVGKITGPRVAAIDFQIDGHPALDMLIRGNYHRQFENDPEKSEYFVPVEWIKTVSLAEGIREPGLFGNQNTVCRPTIPKWRHTVDQLKQKFGITDVAP